MKLQSTLRQSLHSLLLFCTAMSWFPASSLGTPPGVGRILSSLSPLAVFELTGEVPVSPAPKETATTYKGRTIAAVMNAAGADWLARAEREKIEQPEKLLDALTIQEGMTVADVGSGVGYFSLRLAKRVGSRGRVLASDIQQEMLNLLKKNLDRDRISNVEPILGDANDPRLPAGEVDLALLVDVYHEFQFPEQMIAGIWRALKPDGRLVLVEYRGEDPTVPIKPEHKMTAKQVLFEIEPMGFRLKAKLEFLPWQHIFIFAKAEKPE